MSIVDSMSALGDRLYQDTEAVVGRSLMLRQRPWRQAVFQVPPLRRLSLRRLDSSMPGQHFVLATREGLVGKQTATGMLVTSSAVFVALPSQRALYRTVRVTNPQTGLSILAPTLDVGPWNIDDDTYVLDASGTARPQAESGIDRFGRQTNGAGIDLSDGAWAALRMTDNAQVMWQFVDTLPSQVVSRETTDAEPRRRTVH